MKNRLLPLVFVLGLGSYSAYSQVGIGTNNPYTGAQLEIFSNKVSGNKGVLIPRVKLLSLTDNLTVNVTAAKSLDGSDSNSMLVFNTAIAPDLTPGYYYWTTATNSWNRIASAADIAAASGVIGADGLAGVAGAPGTR